MAAAQTTKKPVEKSKANAAAKKAATKAAAPMPRPAAPAAGSPAPTPGARPAANPYAVILHPMVTEKTMFNMDKNNALEFVVHPRATKPEIATAIEQLFTVKVLKVTTRITREGKRAVVRFAEGYSAEDIGTRIGVF